MKAAILREFKAPLGIEEIDQPKPGAHEVLIEVVTAGYLASDLKDAVGFLLMVLVLWTRPSGLFGRAAVRRA